MHQRAQPRGETTPSRGDTICQPKLPAHISPRGEVMESKSKVFGHPAHTLLVVFPLGLLMTSVVFDLLARGEKKAERAKTAQAMIGAGVIGGLLAAPPGWWDWFFIPHGTRAKRVGLVHGVGNVIVLGFFALSWLARRKDPANPSRKAKTLSLTGAVLVGGTAWLGGELVNRLGIGVDKGANPNAPFRLVKKRKFLGLF